MDDHQKSSPPPDKDAGRRPVVATLLSLLAPGLGLMYVGRLLAGLVVNISFVLLVLLFVIAGTVLKFFPLYPALVLVGTWLVLCGLSSWRAVEIIDGHTQRRGRSYQHPLIYLLVAIVTFMAPLAVTGHFTMRHLMTVVSVDDTSMVPGVHPGDKLLVDRTGFQTEAPTRGELVIVEVPDTGQLVPLRIVGLPGDNIQMHGYTLAINDELTEHHRADDRFDALPSGAAFNGEVWLEENHNRHYPVTLVPGTYVDTGIPQSELGDEQFFVLSDNRSFVDDHANNPVDSRRFGTIGPEHIRGRPLYILWSTDPDSGAIDWERIGLSAP